MKKILLDAVCPHCHAGLTHGDWIELKIRLADGQTGIVSLSTFFNDYAVKLPFFIAEGAMAVFHCPHCNAELNRDYPCTLCAAPMFTLGIKGGGKIDACTRRGCKGHALGGFGDPDELLMLLNKVIDTPYL